jgi:hypothetical protein
VKGRDIPGNPKQQSEAHRGNNPDDPRPERTQDNRGECDLHEVQNAERIRRPAGKSEDQRQTDRIQDEKSANQVFRSTAQSVSSSMEDDVAEGLKSDCTSNSKKGHGYPEADRQDRKQRHFSCDQADAKTDNPSKSKTPGAFAREAHIGFGAFPPQV